MKINTMYWNRGSGGLSVYSDWARKPKSQIQAEKLRAKKFAAPRKTLSEYNAQLKAARLRAVKKYAKLIAKRKADLARIGIIT